MIGSHVTCRSVEVRASTAHSAIHLTKSTSALPTMKISHAFMLLSCIAAVAAAMTDDSRQLLYKRTQLPPQWSIIGRSHPKQTIQVKLGLKQNNLDVLDEIFWGVSTPSSPMYGEYWSTEEINSIITPSIEDIDRAIAWLVSSGVSINNIHSFGDSITFKTSVKIIEQLFETEMYGFAHDSGRAIIRQMGEFSIPMELTDIIELVTGVSDFPMRRPNAIKAAAAVNDNTMYVVPQTFTVLYSLDSSSYEATHCSQAAVEFQDDSSYNQADLTTFYEQTNVHTTNITHTVGPYSGEYPDVEATLDVQYITAVGINAENWYWTADNWMYDWCNDFFKATAYPDVVSLSWGWSEVGQCSIDSDCNTYGFDSKTYVDRVNVEFQKIGIRGTSIIVASGDSGCNGRTDGGCTDSQLHPDFPASSPYVTTVGATQLNNPTAVAEKDRPEVCKGNYECAASGHEVAVSYDVAGFASGGGFSVYAARPSYQDAAVSAYLNGSTELPPASYFNSYGRGYPDVAALGNNFLIYYSEEWMPVGGTSASAPTFAGIISIINSERVKAGKCKLGFLNPFLYKMAEEAPHAFNDITEGDNICTEDGCASTCKGYKAAHGWDPVTGLGSPSVYNMIEYSLSY